MRISRGSKTFAAVGISAIAVLGLSACSGGGDTSAAEPTTEETTAAAESAAPAGGDELVGSGCAAYAEQVPDGAGSVDGMAMDPVATAASNNPVLTTLTKAVSGELNPDVNLVDTLNGDEFTVLAPVDDAFAKIPEKDLNGVVEDADKLTEVLTYHVIPGRLSPDEIKGELETVQGDKVKVSGEGEDMKFNDASLVCGGVSTANATVYMIDGVLMPEAK